MNNNEKYNDKLEESPVTAEEVLLDDTQTVSVFNGDEYNAAFDKDDEVAEWAEELAVEYPDKVPALDPVETRPIVPNFGTGFRGYNKGEVDDFIEELIAYYGGKLKNVDTSEINKLKSEITALKKENKALKNVKPSKVNPEAEAEKTIKHAHDFAQKILARAEQEASRIIAKADKEKEKLVAMSAKEQEKQLAKFNQIVSKAEKKAADIIAKAERKAGALEIKQKAVLEEAKKTIAEYQEKNQRLLAFYATQIKVLKKENKSTKN